MISCPFCDATARSKEHVWPKWLRKYPAYQAMTVGRSGERFARTEYLRGNASPSKKHVAEYLPNVQADVCNRCNNGWMSAMEVRVRDLLHPVMSSESATIDLDETAQSLLAAWFSKCVYCYAAAVFSDPNRPWASDDYTALRETQQPAANGTIWAGVSSGQYADIVLSLTPIFLTPLAIDADPLPGDRPTMASAWLSANGAAFFGLWMPASLVIDGLPARLVGDDTSLMRIWPPSPATSWPQGLVSDEEAADLVNLLATIRDMVGIPVDILTPDEVDSRKSEMRDQAAAQGRIPRYAMVQRVLAKRPENMILEGEMSPWPRPSRRSSQTTDE